MAFKGYREDRRGNWFSTQVITNHWSDLKDCEFYIINEQDGYFIRVSDEQQKEVLKHMFSCGLGDEEIDWLKNQSGFQYFDSVDEFDSYHKEMVKNL